MKNCWLSLSFSQAGQDGELYFRTVARATAKVEGDSHRRRPRQCKQPYGRSKMSLGNCLFGHGHSIVWQASIGLPACLGFPEGYSVWLGTAYSLFPVLAVPAAFARLCNAYRVLICSPALTTRALANHGDERAGPCP